ncbi:MAG: hypothetical protein HOI70_07195 [Opitutae bacterium]|nr:hypothetical protein [Opitutae bacterium]
MAVWGNPPCPGCGKKGKTNANVVILIRLVVRMANVSSTTARAIGALFARNITPNRIYIFMPPGA